MASRREGAMRLEHNDVLAARRQSRPGAAGLTGP